jgi:hypothetical protein
MSTNLHVANERMTDMISLDPALAHLQRTGFKDRDHLGNVKTDS